MIDSREQYRTVRERVAGWLAALIEANALPTHERVRTGDLLGRLGDPRDLEELIAIPAGPFWMGSKEEGTILDERPQHQVTFPVYRIGKYPVTVGQWKKFLAANPGHQYDPDSLKGFDNQPAHDVSWHDACTYCDWLTAVWRKANKISANERARLPSEAEWEKAARGDDRREWPWEGDFDPANANTSETGIGRTTAVGMFPTGASPYGCLDMAGNVWERTRSKSKKYPYKSDDGREDLKGNAGRVLRGGSFDLNRRYARCAAR